MGPALDAEGSGTGTYGIITGGLSGMSNPELDDEVDGAETDVPVADVGNAPGEC